MIDAQDVAIFKSQKDYIRDKQKLSEYIHYAQMRQVLSVIFSYTAFTCNIILVMTLIVFLIKCIPYKILKDNASHAYSIYNYEHE